MGWPSIRLGLSGSEWMIAMLLSVSTLLTGSLRIARMGTVRLGKICKVSRGIGGGWRNGYGLACGMDGVGGQAYRQHLRQTPPEDRLDNLTL